MYVVLTDFEEPIETNIGNAVLTDAGIESAPVLRPAFTRKTSRATSKLHRVTLPLRVTYDDAGNRVIS